MSSDQLPARPSLNQLRRRAKELRDAARSGDPAATARITVHTAAAGSGAMTLAAAQLAIAREHGFGSWPQLKAEAEARTAELAQRAEEFAVASVRDWTGQAARMLARDPELAGYDFRTAVITGEASQVREMLARDPGLATRTDTRTGWTALHAACASRWHRLDPDRAAGLTEVARMLIDAGADPGVTAVPPGRSAEGGGRWSPLLCAVAGEPNPDITRLLLGCGARPDDDHVLYLAAFETGHACLRLLLPHAAGIATTTALAAPISADDTAGVRILLDAGADPNHPLDSGLLGEPKDQSPPVPPLSAAIELESGPELITLLLERGADPDTPDGHDRTPYQQAVRTGQELIAELLARHGASTSVAEADRFLAACRHADRAAAGQILNADPGLAARITTEDHRALIDAADHGHTEAVRLMLDLGFPPDTRAAPSADGITALHAAAAAGSAPAVRLLLERGAGIEARDTNWDSTPLEWAIIGSGMHLGHDSESDWPATVRALLDAGASTEGITLTPDDPKPPSPEVTALLRARGIPEQASTATG